MAERLKVAGRRISRCSGLDDVERPVHRLGKVFGNLEPFNSSLLRTERLIPLPPVVLRLRLLACALCLSLTVPACRPAVDSTGDNTSSITVLYPAEERLLGPVWDDTPKFLMFLPLVNYEQDAACGALTNSAIHEWTKRVRVWQAHQADRVGDGGNPGRSYGGPAVCVAENSAISTVFGYLRLLLPPNPDCSQSFESDRGTPRETT